jgi:tetratricopeptide (TPR) repeat protein
VAVVEDVLRRARILADLGRYEAADPLLAVVLAAEPDNEEGLSLLSRGLVARRRFDEAATVTEQLLRTQPDSVRGLLAMARIKCLLRRKREGVAFARRAVELYPDNATCLETLADVLRQVTHGSAEALALARRAVEVEPEYARAKALVGEIHLDLHQYAEAEWWILQALRITPDDPWMVIQIGLARAGLGRFDESRDQVALALQLGATPSLIDQVIEYIEASGLPGHLSEIYRMALAARGLPDVSSPGAAGDDPELLATQGKLAWRMYSRDSDHEGLHRAGELAAAVLAADPGNADARYVRARVLSEAGQYEQALPIAEQLLAEGYPDADLALVVACSGAADHAGALAAARRLLARNPDSPMYLRAQAHALRKLSRYGEALESAQRAAALSPSAVGVQEQLGLCAKAVGELTMAERALRAAVAHAPGDGYPAAELALLLAQNGSWSEAETLIAGLTADLPDVHRLFHPCLELGPVILEQAQPATAALLDGGELGPDVAEQSARWLGLLLKIYVLATAGRPTSAARFSGNVARLVGILHEASVPEGSSLAGVIRGFDVLLESWRSA